jgi:hypothetical protein
MNDDRATIHLPDVSQQDQPEQGPDRVPERGPEQVRDDKPTTAALAGSGSAGAERATEPHGSAKTPAQVGTSSRLANGLNSDPNSGPNSGTAEIAHLDEKTAPLFPGDEAGKLNQRWTAIQAGFVDEPRKAVEDADSLVASAMTRLAEMFADERARLEGQWDRGGEVSTEDLRVALRRYRAFFGRLLAI